MNVEQWPMDRIIPYARNPRDNRAAVAAVKASIKEFGFRQPIVVDKDGVIVAGHTRYLAAQQLELDSVPVHVATELSPIQIKAYRLADNRTADNATWDDDLLKLELQELQEGDFDLGLTGFDDADLTRLIDQSLDTSDVDAEPQIDKAEELREKWGVTSGQLWQLGDHHRLICGDCTDPAIVARVMDNEKSRLVVTSPPYNQDVGNFSKSGMHAETQWVDNVNSGSYLDNLPEDEYQQTQIKSITCWSKVLTDDASIFYNHKNRFRNKECISPWNWIVKTGAKVRQEIIWKREGSVTQNARMFMPCDERIFWLYYGNDFFFDDTTEHKTWSSVWEIASYKDREQSLHGCAFPMELALRPIAACSEIGDIILEPYCGSGTTIIACERLGRKCRAIEISPAYVAVTLQRFQDATGIEPKLLSG